MIDEIGKLKAKHPMPLSEKLEDEEWVRGRQGELGKVLDSRTRKGYDCTRYEYNL